MRKHVPGIILALIIALSAAPLLAAEEAAPRSANPVDQFTGQYWVNTTQVAKEAYLFGIESAIEVEYYINWQMAARAAKAGKKPSFTLSRFEKDWMEAFKDITSKQIVEEIDKWYAEHPAQLDKPVLTVIWEDLIVPRIDNRK